MWSQQVFIVLLRLCHFEGHARGADILLLLELLSSIFVGQEMLGEVTSCCASLEPSADKDIAGALSQFTSLTNDFVAFEGNNSNHSCFAIATRLCPQTLVCKLLFHMLQERLVTLASIGWVVRVDKMIGLCKVSCTTTMWSIFIIFTRLRFLQVDEGGLLIWGSIGYLVNLRALMTKQNVLILLLHLLRLSEVDEILWGSRCRIFNAAHFHS